MSILMPEMPPHTADQREVNANLRSARWMSRGVLVLDGNLLDLRRPLERKNFRVFPLNVSETPDEIAAMLAHRVLITQNAKDYLETAAIVEFSIIDVADTSGQPIMTADLISAAWSQMRLRGKQPFVLRLMKRGNHAIEPVE